MNNKEYYVEIAQAVSKKSKDPSSKVGCVIVDSEGLPVSWGYNGFIRKCDESLLTWERPMKYLYVLHAEENAVLFADQDLTGCKAYVTHGPCEGCLKRMLQKGIREIYYKDSSIIKDRGTLDQKEAIKQMIMATDAIVENINGQKYVDEIYFREV